MSTKAPTFASRRAVVVRRDATSQAKLRAILEAADRTEAAIGSPRPRKPARTYASLLDVVARIMANDTAKAAGPANAAQESTQQAKGGKGAKTASTLAVRKTPRFQRSPLPDTWPPSTMPKTKPNSNKALTAEHLRPFLRNLNLSESDDEQ